MDLSASALNAFTKCGYKWYLTKVKGIEEPGKKGYNMLLGDIVGDAIQACALHLNTHKVLPDDVIAELLAQAYEDRFRKAGIPDSILAPIREVLTEGESEAVMRLLDSMSVCINVSNYEFNPPAPLKSGKTSMNKKKPPFCMKVVNSLASVMWFFDERHEHVNLIRYASHIENEKWFEYFNGGEREVSINGSVLIERDKIRGKFDMFLVTPENRKYIFELKYTNTPYTQELVNKMNQNLTYHTAEPEATVMLVDITEERVYTVSPEERLKALLQTRYSNMSHMIRNQVFMPACGTDPYSDKKMLCGFKCSGCEYGANTGSEESEYE